MGILKNYHRTNGFALPSVLIASIVMLIVLLAAVTSTASVRVSLAAQYYNSLSQTAADAGMAYAKACLSVNNGIPRWSDSNPLLPNTDCEGQQIAGFTCPTINVDPRCAVMVNDNVKSSFSVGSPDTDINNKATIIRSVGIVSLLRSSNDAVWRTYNQSIAATTSYPGIVTSNLVMNLDAGDSNSYPGVGSAWTDLSGNNNGGTLLNGVGYSSSNGGSMIFDGGNDFVDIGDSANFKALTYPLTFSMWVKPDTLSQNSVIMNFNVNDTNSGYAMGIYANQNSILVGKNTYQYGLSRIGSYLVSGQWAEWTTVFTDPTHISFYLNGASQTLSNVANYWAVGTSGSKIGQRTNTEAFDGSISDVRIYNRALSSAEIQQNYNALSSRYFDRQVQLLVVAGGGNGGGGWQGGGGGGGGVIYSPITPVTTKSYNVTVGAGGAGGGTPSANLGGDSSFDTIIAKGGGYGAGEPNGGTQLPTNGGSGGGGSHGNYSGPTFVGLGTIGQGSNGGQGVSDGTAPGYYVGGGGGGAGVVGQDATHSKGGNGGDGLAFSISGASVYYGGGGGGSFRGGTAGTGGLGGGGNGGTTGANGVANTGGGGGAGNGTSGTGVSGSGGSGIVIVSYPTGLLTAVGGTITTVAGRTIHTFTSNGTFTVRAQQRTSCLDILNSGESVGSGIYLIYPSGGAALQVYCDMTTSGGGWTLILTNPGPYSIWNTSNVLSFNGGTPSISAPYSILNKADLIKSNIYGNLQYRIDAVSFGHWGGVWQAPFTNTFIGTTVVNNATNIQQYDAWTINTALSSTNSLSNVMPWIGNATQVLSTWGNAGSWWGTLVAGAGGYSPSPYIYPEQPNPGIIWYWVK